VLTRHRRDLSKEYRARVEIIPSAGLAARVVSAFPRSTTLTVTCLPKDGIRRTIDATIELSDLGYDVVPHLAARQIGGEKELRRHLVRLDEAGVNALFVIGGDGKSTDDTFGSGGELLRSIRELTGERFTAGVAGYPDGHPAMSIDRALEVLAEKQELADCVVTQMCFNTATLVAYLSRLQTVGITLPVWFGVPGTVRMSRLLAIAARIGVGPSLSFARKSHNLRLITGNFDSNQFRDHLLDSASEAGLPFAGFHLYSFNDFASGE
jgi:methylenetetrahydrofolate reductase (NADPH)